jgi:hypothetical protein
MLSRVLIGVMGAAGAAVIGVPGTSWADPLPTPVLPNINAYALALPSDYSARGNGFYLFSTSDGLTCAIDRGTGGYGCSGPMSGAPDGADVVTAAATGPPAFATAGRPIFADLGPAKLLAPMTRLSFREISCGTDGAGFTACVNLHDQTGFVISPGNSYILGSSAPPPPPP